ncbi:MAG: hypothetical protein ACI4WS_09865 [Oscillospiraceae bacterium]
MKINGRLGLWLLIPAWVLAFVARLVQITSGTDMEHGFLSNGNGFFMDFCFWGAVVLTLAAGIAAAVFDRKKEGALYTTPVPAITGGRAAAIGFAMLLPAMAALYEGYCEAVIPAESNISPSPFMMVIDFLFGGIMLIVAFVTVYFKEFKPGLGFSMVAGAGYYTLCGIGVFIERMAITTIPEYLINCMAMIFAAVFFMQLTKLLSGNEGRRTRETLYVSGAVSAVTILGNAAAVFAASVAGPAEVSSRIVTSSAEAEMLYQLSYGRDAYYMSYMPVSLVAAGLFIVVTLIALNMKPGTAVEAPAEENAAPQIITDDAPEE